MILNTYIFTPVRVEFIGRALLTLYKYTNMENSRVIVIDQTKDGLNNTCKEWNEIKSLIHLYMHSYRNLGFAKANNEGIIHGLHWNSAYITCANDDIEFIHPSWFSGILETFNSDNARIIAVNPMSTKEPGWGYGLEHGKYIDLLPYKEVYSEEDYQYLLKGDFSNVQGLPDSFPRLKTGVIDAIATWCTTFKKEAFAKIGLFDERYYPGGGEDYDLNARAYRQNLRMVGTTRSWAWHWWGSSKDKQNEMADSLPIKEELRWMNPDYLWPPEKNLSWNEKEQKMLPTSFDPWGHVTLQDGSKKPMYRIANVGIVEI